jgi:hypothetical protein
MARINNEFHLNAKQYEGESQGRKKFAKNIFKVRITPRILVYTYEG